MISKFKSRRDAYFHTFTKLFYSCVVPISEYFPGIWGFKKNSAINTFQSRACRFYLERHAEAPILGFQGETGWTLPKYRHILSMWRDVVITSNNPTARQVLLWDFKYNSWSHELRCSEPKLCEVYNLTIVENHVLVQQENEWREVFLNKQKM